MFYLLLDLFLSYFKIGFFGFGGGYAMLALMEHEIIKVHDWMSMTEFVDIIAVAEMTPGPVAINSATFVGFRVAGIAGSVLATLGVISPSLILIIPAAKLFSRYYEQERIQRLLYGIQPAVISLIALAAFVVGESAIIDYKTTALSLIFLLLALFSRIHPLALIGIGAAAGLLFFH